MDTKTKAALVGEAWLATRGLEQWEKLHYYLDIGFPLCFAVANDYVTSKKKGNVVIEDSWDVLTKVMGIDPEGTYKNFAEMLDAMEV